MHVCCLETELNLVVVAKRMTNLKALCNRTLHFEFERRRNRPERYNRDVVDQTLKAIKKIEEVRGKRESKFWESRWVLLVNFPIIKSVNHGDVLPEDLQRSCPLYLSTLPITRSWFRFIYLIVEFVRPAKLPVAVMVPLL